MSRSIGVVFLFCFDKVKMKRRCLYPRFVVVLFVLGGKMEVLGCTLHFLFLGLTVFFFFFAGVIWKWKGFFGGM